MILNQMENIESSYSCFDLSGLDKSERLANLSNFNNTAFIHREYRKSKDQELSEDIMKSIYHRQQLRLQQETANINFMDKELEGN